MKKTILITLSLLLIPLSASAWWMIAQQRTTAGGWSSGNALAVVLGPDSNNPDWSSLNVFVDTGAYDASISISYSGGPFNADRTDWYGYDGSCAASDPERIGHDGSNDAYVILRFDNVTIPKDTTITAASVTVYQDIFGNTPYLKVWGIKELDTAALSSGDCGYTRDRTTAEVDWDPSDAGWGNALVTSDIKTIIQEIVNQ